ncbi:hypothetical protein [Diaphorobacter aerolatus]|uniref:Uncharacterized protein n=1 Tax=Diaphorobacter aerolatus TaxID=1288495 RepID=A0A7H0GGE7_9BURK|nr:hypothetical protein [Diaphorobacter aerolatus]QNP47363.1 hypothetical protein H9K75_13555 [Diaphorobacter aerolatus]
MKKILGLVLVILMTFFAGYRLGVYKNNEYTVEYTITLSNQIAASKSVATIHELDKIRALADGNKELVCSIQREVIRQSEDYNKCKLNDACSIKMKGNYADFDALVSNYKKITCN